MSDSKLVKVGETPLLQKMVKEAAALSPSKERILGTAVSVRQEPDAYELAYMARELVQCTLPHKNPGDVPAWGRTNGNLSLGISPGWDFLKKQSIGFPYGSIPRLLICWINTEAVQTGKRRLDLGDTFGGFVRDIGLNPNTGRGKRGDAKRLRDQMRRLFASRISFQQTTRENEREAERWVNMQVSSKGELWWDPKNPEQIGMWGSWIELGEDFFKAITAAPVPVDMRALRALKHSPLALDLYIWSTHKVHSVLRNGKPQFVSWRGLMGQFGADYNDLANFRKKATARLKMIQVVYPDLRLAEANGGLQILPTSKLAIPSKTS
jgi:hypothetical protein